MKEFLISFRESFSLLAAPYRSGENFDILSRYTTPSCFSWEVVYVLLVVEFSVITKTQFLAQLMDILLKYTVFLFLGSCVRFACCGVLYHHTDTLSVEAFLRH